MAVFTLDTEEAKKEAEVLMIVNNLVSRKEFGLNNHIMPYQDNALGLWLMNYKNIK